MNRREAQQRHRDQSRHCHPLVTPVTLRKKTWVFRCALSCGRAFNVGPDALSHARVFHCDDPPGRGDDGDREAGSGGEQYI